MKKINMISLLLLNLIISLSGWCIILYTLYMLYLAPYNSILLRANYYNELIFEIVLSFFMIIMSFIFVFYFIIYIYRKN